MRAKNVLRVWRGNACMLRDHEIRQVFMTLTSLEWLLFEGDINHREWRRDDPSVSGCERTLNHIPRPEIARCHARGLRKRHRKTTFYHVVPESFLLQNSRQDHPNIDARAEPS